MELIILFLFLLNLNAVISQAVEGTPTFSLKSGFYYKKNLLLEIFSSDPKAEIFYTTDGSIPTVNSFKYTNGILLKNRTEADNVLSAKTKISSDGDLIPSVKVKKINVIRAIAKLSNGKLSDIANGSFFVGIDREENYGNLPIISMITDPANLFDYEKGIYCLGKRYDDWIAENPSRKYYPAYQVEGNFSNRGKEAERPAYVEYFPSKTNATAFAENLGIRIMGAATRTYYQKSFHFTFREEYGKKNLKYEVIPNNLRDDGKGNVKKYKSFNVRNGGNDTEYSKLRDKVLQDLISNRDSIQTQQSDYAILFIDGEYWGVYVICENYSDNHIANNYNIDNENVIIIKKEKVEAGLDSDLDIYKEFKTFITTTDFSEKLNYEKLKEIIDVESFAWYYAFNTYIENKDGIFQGGNWAMWRVREPLSNVKHADGKWRMMVYDSEYSTGLYGNGEGYNSINISNVLKYNQSNFGALTFVSLMKNKNFKNLYINALSDIVNIDFESSKVSEYIYSLSSILTPLMKDQIERFGPMHGRNNPTGYFTNQVNIFDRWLSSRHNYFMDGLSNIFGFERAVSVTVTSNDFKLGSFIINNGWKVFNEKFTGSYFKENILYITAKPTEGKSFVYWKLKSCKFANAKYQSVINRKKSFKETIGIYPYTGCKVTAYFSN